MRALTVRQPWAWAIAHGKDIENRDWSTCIRGVIAIHAAKGMTHYEYLSNQSFIEGNAAILPPLERIVRGAIIGTVEIVDCVTTSDSVWFEGPCGFVLKGFQPCEPVPCKGALGFWTVPEEIERLVTSLQGVDDPLYRSGQEPA